MARSSLCVAALGAMVACSSSTAPPAPSEVTSSDACVVAAAPAYCSELPAVPSEHVELIHVPASEDFTFDRLGNLVGVQFVQGGLIHTPNEGAPRLVVPGVSGAARGIRFLPTGDLVVADPATSSLIRIAPNGAVDTLRSNLANPNGVVIGADGTVFATLGEGGEGGRVVAIDPETGALDELHRQQGESYNGIALGTDCQTVYFSQETGTVHAVDASSGSVEEFAVVPVADALDGMTVDECGNLYVVDLAGIVWRVTPDGEPERYYEISVQRFVSTPALEFGSGHGGWRRDALYVMDFNGGVFEIETGGVRGQRGLEP